MAALKKKAKDRWRAIDGAPLISLKSMHKTGYMYLMPTHRIVSVSRRLSLWDSVCTQCAQKLFSSKNLNLTPIQKQLIASTGKGLKVNHRESADRQKEIKEDIDMMSVTIV